MDGQHLHILWTNADPVVFDKMVLMYAVNSLVRGWWEKVTVILLSLIHISEPTRH